MADPAGFFKDLLALAVLAVPLRAALPGPRSRRILLVLVGMILVARSAPRLLLFWLGYWLGIHALTGPVDRSAEGPWGTKVLAGALLLAALPMAAWKLRPEAFLVQLTLALHHVLEGASAWLGGLDAIHPALVPIGLSFGTFRALDLLMKIHLGAVPRPGILDTLAFGFFPAVLMVGPIATPEELAGEEPRAPARDLLAGGGRVLAGWARLHLLAMPLAFSHELVVRHAELGCRGASLWAATLIHPWYFYWNFAGFSDLAIGSARLFGYRVGENFDHPFARTSLQGFWAAWHMSLTGWAQRNVFVPAGGYRPETQYRAVLATMMAVALWHDLSIPLVLFGLLHGGVLCAERRAGRREGPGGPSYGPASIPVFLFVALTLPLLLMDLGELPGFYAALVGNP